MSDQPAVEQRPVEQNMPPQPQEGFIPVAPIEAQEARKPAEFGTAASKGTLINPQISEPIASSKTTDTGMASTNDWRGYGYTPTEDISGVGTPGDDMSRRVRAKTNGEPPTE